MKRLTIVLAFILIATTARADDGALRIAQLGDFTLASGQVMRDCRVGYRTWGQLAADRSNAIVLTTWFAGTSEGYGGWVGPAKLFDSSKFFVIVIDAFGDGVSSSPSNSSQQPGAQFPRFTIRDMVRAQHELLTRELKLDHVYAVGGLSMGGMQTFQWIVSYPMFMDKAVAIVGTPKQTSYDLVLWKTELDILESFRDLPDSRTPAMNAVADVQLLGLWTPEYIAAHTSSDAVDAFIQSHRDALRKKDPYDYASQLRAMIGHDIYREFGGSSEAAAKAIKAKMLVVASLQDHMVQPSPAREFARLAKAEIVTLTGNCGHLASGCERDLITREVTRFLSAK